MLHLTPLSTYYQSTIGIADDIVPEAIWDKEDSVNFLKKIISNDTPVVIKNLPLKLFKLFELDLMKLGFDGVGSSRGLNLNFIQWQNQQVFIASHEREKGIPIS